MSFIVSERVYDFSVMVYTELCSLDS